MKKNWKIAVSVFAAAFLLGLNITGIMPVLGLVRERYSSYSTGTIQLLQTVSYALLLVGSLVIGKLTTLFTKKRIVLAGMLIVGVFGVLPFFSDSFYLLFACRVLIGFGFGIVSPLILAIITDFFPPEERAGYMGLNVVGMGVGAMIGNLLGGILASAGLRCFYLVYGLAFPGMLAIALLLPETPVTALEKAARIRLKPIVYILSLIYFFFTIFSNAYNTNISLFMTERISADPGVAGMATAVNAVCALGFGLLFSRVVNVLKKNTLPFAVMVGAIAYIAVLCLPGMAGVLICSSFCGISLSCFNAMGGFLLSVSVEKEAVASASGIYSVFGSIGGLIAPIVLGAACTPLGGNTPVNEFTIAAAGMFILFAVVSIHIRTVKD